VEFIEAPLFTKVLYQYLSDDEYRGLQAHLANYPNAGDIIRGTGGFRKLRGRSRGDVKDGAAA
jgi:hypothetical protein